MAEKLARRRRNSETSDGTLKCVRLCIFGSSQCFVMLEFRHGICARLFVELPQEYQETLPINHSSPETFLQLHRRCKSYWVFEPWMKPLAKVLAWSKPIFIHHRLKSAAQYVFEESSHSVNKGCAKYF